MQIEQERDGNKLILKLSGRLDTNTAPQLQEVVERDLEEITELTADMSSLEYVSSAGLRVLLAAAKNMKAKGGTLTVTGANQDIKQVFIITGFQKVLNVQ